MAARTEALDDNPSRSRMSTRHRSCRWLSITGANGLVSRPAHWRPRRIVRVPAIGGADLALLDRALRWPGLGRCPAGRAMMARHYRAAAAAAGMPCSETYRRRWCTKHSGRLAAWSSDLCPAAVPAALVNEPVACPVSAVIERGSAAVVAMAHTAGADACGAHPLPGGRRRSLLPAANDSAAGALVARLTAGLCRTLSRASRGRRGESRRQGRRLPCN